MQYRQSFKISQRGHIMKKSCFIGTVVHIVITHISEHRHFQR